MIDKWGLEVIPRGSKARNVGIIGAIATHDLYHAKQTQLFKRLIR